MTPVDQLAGPELDREVGESLRLEPIGHVVSFFSTNQTIEVYKTGTMSARGELRSRVGSRGARAWRETGRKPAYRRYSADPTAYKAARTAASEQGLGWVVATPHAGEYMALFVSASTSEGVIIAENGVPGFGHTEEEAGCRAIILAARAQAVAAGAGE